MPQGAHSRAVVRIKGIIFTKHLAQCPACDQRFMNVCCCCYCCYYSYCYYLGEQLSSLNPSTANQPLALKCHERCGHSATETCPSLWVLPQVWGLLVSLVPSQTHPLSPTAHCGPEGPPSLLYALPTQTPQALLKPGVPLGLSPDSTPTQ